MFRFFGFGYEFQAGFWYLSLIYLYDYFHPRRSLPRIAPSWIELILQVSFGLWFYDFIFYWIHVFMHKPKWVFRNVILFLDSNLHFKGNIFNKCMQNKIVRLIFEFIGTIHLQHHGWGNQTLRAAESMRHGFIDLWLQLGVNILVQNMFNKHPMSRMFHVIIVIYMLVECHSGYDLPWFMHNLFPTIFGGSIAHDLHHKHGNVHFHQFFLYLDQYFGFVYKPDRNNKSCKQRRDLIFVTDFQSNANLKNINAKDFVQ